MPAQSGASGPTTTSADLLRPAERDHSGVVGDVERHDLSLVGDAGIARRAIEALDQRARCDLPGKRVLATTGAEEAGCSWGWAC